MLPTPAKFHYVFNLRDLSRIWEGMLNVTNEGVTTARALLNLWKHECTRVIADRFTNNEDKTWFEKALTSLVFEELGEEVANTVANEPYFVDFLRFDEFFYFLIMPVNLYFLPTNTFFFSNWPCFYIYIKNGNIVTYFILFLFVFFLLFKSLWMLSRLFLDIES